MAVFEFVMVLVSIIVGLAMAELLIGIRGVLRSSPIRRPYWIHLLIVAQVFNLLVQQWWYRWSLEGQDAWSFYGVFFFLLGPVLLYLIAGLLFPPESSSVELRDYYHDKARVLMILLALLFVYYQAESWWIRGNPMGQRGDWFRLTLIACFIAGAVSRRVLVHGVVATVTTVATYLAWSPLLGGQSGLPPATG